MPPSAAPLRCFYFHLPLSRSTTPGLERRRATHARLSHLDPGTDRPTANLPPSPSLPPLETCSRWTASEEREKNETRRKREEEERGRESARRSPVSYLIYSGLSLAARRDALAARWRRVANRGVGTRVLCSRKDGRGRVEGRRSRRRGGRARVRFSVGRERRIGGAEGRRTGGSSEARSSQRGVHRATVGSGGDGGGGAYGPTARQVAPAERSAAESPVSPACSGGWNGDGWLVVDVGRLATAGDRPAVCRPPFAPRLPPTARSATTLARARFPPIAKTAVRNHHHRTRLSMLLFLVFFFFCFFVCLADKLLCSGESSIGGERRNMIDDR